MVPNNKIDSNKQQQKPTQYMLFIYAGADSHSANQERKKRVKTSMNPKQNSREEEKKILVTLWNHLVK